jgi:hypothetical protein
MNEDGGASDDVRARATHDDVRGVMIMMVVTIEKQENTTRRSLEM